MIAEPPGFARGIRIVFTVGFRVAFAVGSRGRGSKSLRTSGATQGTAWRQCGGRDYRVFEFSLPIDVLTTRAPNSHYRSKFSITGLQIFSTDRCPHYQSSNSHYRWLFSLLDLQNFTIDRCSHYRTFEFSSAPRRSRLDSGPQQRRRNELRGWREISTYSVACHRASTGNAFSGRLETLADL